MSCGSRGQPQGGRWSHPTWSCSALTSGGHERRWGRVERPRWGLQIRPFLVWSLHPLVSVPNGPAPAAPGHLWLLLLPVALPSGLWWRLIFPPSPWMKGGSSQVLRGLTLSCWPRDAPVPCVSTYFLCLKGLGGFLLMWGRSRSRLGVTHGWVTHRCSVMLGEISWVSVKKFKACYLGFYSQGGAS